MVVHHELHVLIPRARAAEFPVGAAIVMSVRAATEEETKHAVAAEAKAAEESTAWRSRAGVMCGGAP